MTLHGKTAVVTGGSRGIGREIAIALGARGAYVFVNYVSRADAAEETIGLVRQAGGDGAIVQCDVADFSATQEAMKEVVGQAGSVDILINNAGITRDGLLPLMKEADWDQVLDTNLKGAFNCSKAVVRSMMKKKWGRIVNISSVVGFSGNAGQANYAAAKAGMVGLTKSLAREFASRRITVNCVAPGYIVTEMTEALPEVAQQKLIREIPLGTLGSAADVAAAALFFVNDEAAYVTGQTIHVNGGMYM
ncbi:3-oxoacyl-[acyl-carrier-protein] reductase [Desulfofustis glycolicus]|uniref:3-oxoacyl-[acyl-carrier-protein] reductase n=1 Tax=Desulfofustis glycolicus DSM 9705 TaxID=1121409 RepID=A0A1M5VSF5_9BACT|nr:3-oxoacyl-[acyl-carrier-protein] reductase [Desulfofustis glycolicus]SHH78201.1 3-oxoacyl-[acyl-carrier-protein] reductase [Desulfofustis glycolicus DSM 9705]